VVTMNKQRKAIWDKSGGKCWYCGCDLPEKGWHADHFEPIHRKLKYDQKRGLYTTDECYHPERDNADNKVPCCASCNIQKGMLTVEQFREKIVGFMNSLNLYYTQYAVAKRYGLIAETGKTVEFWFERNGKVSGERSEHA